MRKLVYPVLRSERFTKALEREMCVVKKVGRKILGVFLSVLCLALLPTSAFAIMAAPDDAPFSPGDSPKAGDPWY